MSNTLDALDRDIAAYDAQRQELEATCTGKYVLFHDSVRIGVYDDFQQVAEDAVRRFGRGPFLIRQVGAPDVVLPASVMFRPVDAAY
jgi:hypothetical protein